MYKFLIHINSMLTVFAIAETVNMLPIRSALVTALTIYNCCIYFSYMKTVLNVKTDRDIKIEATRVSKEMGVPLSIVVTSLLKKFINDRELVLEAPRQMSKKLESIIFKAEKDLNNGTISPIFSNADDAIAWLKK